MRLLILLALLGIFTASCGRKQAFTSQRKQKTPRHMVMSGAEKLSVNYDARENRKIIEKNLKNKQANQKHAEKERQKQVTAMNTANNNTSKVANKSKKYRPHEAFSFY